MSLQDHQDDKKVNEESSQNIEELVNEEREPEERGPEERGPEVIELEEKEPEERKPEVIEQEEREPEVTEQEEREPEVTELEEKEPEERTEASGKASESHLRSGLNHLHRKIDRLPQSNMIGPLSFFTGLLIYLELMLHLINYRAFDLRMIYPILFAIPVGFFITIFTGVFSRKVNWLIMCAVTALACLMFSIQLVYYYVFKVYFSFQTLGMAGDAVNEFGSEVFIAIRNNLPGLILLFLPLPVLIIILQKPFRCERRKLKEQGILAAGMVLLQMLAIVSLLFFGKTDYSPYDLYHHSRVPDLCGKQLGLITYTRFDLLKLIEEDEELILADISDLVPMEPTVAPTATPVPMPTATPAPKGPDATPTPSPPPTPTPIDSSPNVMEIDFAMLAQETKDDTLKTLHQYFASVTPTNKNEYTGRFKGYNLIMITAEGFSPYAVHEELTPTLYRLTNEGFVFNNFYTALWQTSTSDGEFVAMTGLIPVGTRSMYHTRKNLMPFSLGHQFNLLGVESKAYHNHTYTYYQRNQTHPNLGYQFKAKGNGLVLDSEVWPESDLEMINHTVEEYLDEDPFHVYYLTVSGHMNYSFVGNSMSYKNRELVKDLPLSSDVQAYIACQIELDRALEQLIKKLEEAGVADKTVIALSADHYPYGWEKEKLDEIAGHEVDPNFEVYENHFILWNPTMERVVVEKPCSSLDILPTLSNLWGLPYDSRLLMGQDIFSDGEPLVILNNRSFITDKVKYNSETGEILQLTEEELPKDYVKNINKIIKNKFMVSQSIVKKDYYRSIFPDYPMDFH